MNLIYVTRLILDRGILNILACADACVGTVTVILKLEKEMNESDMNDGDDGKYALTSVKLAGLFFFFWGVLSSVSFVLCCTYLYQD